MIELALYSAFYGTPIYCIIIGLNLGRMFERAPKNEDFSANVYWLTGAFTIMMTSIVVSIFSALQKFIPDRIYYFWPCRSWEIDYFKSARPISGDVVSWMHKNGREKPWLSEAEVALIWDNILSITKNFLKRDIDVVIDYVTFPEQAFWLAENVRQFQCEVRYIVLFCEEETLIKRDKERPLAYQMGTRCLELIEEFKAASVHPQYIFDTTKYTPDDLPYILKNIKENEHYKIHRTAE